MLVQLIVLNSSLSLLYITDNTVPYLSEPGCDALSGDREPCSPDLKAPLVNPGSCLPAQACCYDDMFMSESSVEFYDREGRIWCFKKHKQKKFFERLGFNKVI